VWLRDLLPTRVPEPRVMTFGYTLDRDRINIKKRAIDMLEELNSKRRTNEVRAALDIYVLDPWDSVLTFFQEITRPIVFVGHGVGGTIIKQVIVDNHALSMEKWPWIPNDLPRHRLYE